MKTAARAQAEAACGNASRGEESSSARAPLLGPPHRPSLPETTNEPRKLHAPLGRYTLCPRTLENARENEIGRSVRAQVKVAVPSRRESARCAVALAITVTFTSLPIFKWAKIFKSFVAYKKILDLR